MKTATIQPALKRTGQEMTTKDNERMKVEQGTPNNPMETEEKGKPPLNLTYMTNMKVASYILSKAASKILKVKEVPRKGTYKFVSKSEARHFLTKEIRRGGAFTKELVACGYCRGWL